MTDPKKRMTDSKKIGRQAATGSFVPKNPSGSSSLGGPQGISRSTKTGRFIEGVKIVSKRDRDGLIKLADR